MPSSNPRPPRRSVPLLALAVATCCAGLRAQCLLQSFTVNDPVPPTLQGYRIALRGELLVSTYSGSLDPTAHACFVWRRTSGAWGFEEAIVPSTVPVGGSDLDEVDTDGERVLLNRQGSLYVYDHAPAGWTLQAKLTALQGSYWGHPELDGDRLVSRVRLGPDQESLAVLQLVAGQWQPAPTVPIPPTGSAAFAFGVSLSGDVIGVPSPSDVTSVGFWGAVHVYRLVAGSWQKEATLHGEPGASFFGRSAVVDGDDLIVGAHGLSDSIGDVHFFHHDPGGWTPGLVWTDPGADLGTEIGRDVDVRDGLAVAGMRGYDGAAPNSGAVAAFRRGASGWTHVGLLLDPAGEQSAQLGWEVAVDGETVATSALTATGTVPTQGVLYDFSGVPGSEAFADLGGALAGAAGTPCLVGDGQPTAGATVRFTVAHAASAAPAWIIAGSQVVSQPFKGGVLVPLPELVLPGFAAGAEGLFELAGPWPPYVPPGARVVLQAWIADAAAVHGFAATNGLQVTGS